MSTPSDFYDLVMPDLPGCSTAMVDFQLREVAREFCEITSLWRQDLNAVDLVAAQATYVVATPANSTLVRVVTFTVANVLLWKLSQADQSSEAPKYDNSAPPFAFSPDLSTLTLIPDEVPTASLVGGLTINAAIKPSADATALPDFLRSQWSEAMRVGTLSRLMSMNKKPWSDRQLAGFYRAEWGSQLNRAAYQGAVGNTSKQMRVMKWG